MRAPSHQSDSYVAFLGGTRSCGCIAMGKTAFWLTNSAMSLARAGALAQKDKAWSEGAEGVPGATGREPFVHLAYLASKTPTLALATGIANIWARDAVTMAAAQKT